MRTRLANWTRLAVVVVAMAGTQTGCKSGWKMPGTDMFPWSKKPSEATLAGTSPSLSMPSSNPTSPISPAFKNTPSPLVSNAANPGRPASPYGAAGTASPSFNMPPSNPVANNAVANNPMANSQMMNNGAGVSAGANGYSTGPYNMGTNQNRPGVTPPSGYGAPPQSPSAYGNAPAQNSLAGMPNSLPPAYGGTPAGMTAGLPPSSSSSSYAPMGNGGIPAMPAGYNPNSLNPMPAHSSMPNAAPSSYQSSGLPPIPTSGPGVAAQTYSGAAPYRPGSVGRQTGYDFSNQAGGGAGLPPSGVPNTANGLPNGLPNSMNR